MLDDRNATTSAEQYDDRGSWVRESNLLGWSALLGERRGTEDVSIYAAPARATAPDRRSCTTTSRIPSARG